MNKETKAFFYSISRSVLGISHRCKWLKKDLIGILIFLIGIIISLWTFTYFSDPVIDSCSLSITIISSILFLKSIRNFYNSTHLNILFEKQPTLNDKNINITDNYKINTFNNQSIIYDPFTNLSIEKYKNPIVYNSDIFEVHPLIENFRPLFITKMPESKIDTFDDYKVKLVSDINIELLSEGSKVYLQKSSYFRDRLSNTLANYKISFNNRSFLNLREEVINSDNQLIDLESSTLSNQLGGSVILITQDKKIIFLKQGNRTNENCGRPCPAGSGSFDIPKNGNFNNTTFQEYAKSEIARELQEECGIENSDICSLQICGYGRYLYRNGKPELFAISSTKKDAHSINPPVKEWGYQIPKFKKIYNISGKLNKSNLINTLENLLYDLKTGKNDLENSSGPLYWNVLFAIDYIKTMDSNKEYELFNIRP